MTDRGEDRPGGLPVFDVPEPDPDAARGGRRSGRGGSAPPRAGRAVGVVVAGLALLVAGIAVGGRTEPSPSATPTAPAPAPTAAADATETTSSSPLTNRFRIPTATLVAQDVTIAPMTPGCGLTVTLANGGAGADQCNGISYSPGPAASVAALEPLTLELPGWTVLFWDGQCGQVAEGSGTMLFLNRTGCSLGGAASADGRPLSDPVRFVVAPGDQVIRVLLSAVAPNGDRFSVPYYLRVDAR